jgi:hypothetical protein
VTPSRARAEQRARQRRRERDAPVLGLRFIRTHDFVLALATLGIFDGHALAKASTSLGSCSTSSALGAKVNQGDPAVASLRKVA